MCQMYYVVKLHLNPKVERDILVKCHKKLMVKVLSLHDVSLIPLFIVLIIDLKDIIL